MINYLEYTITLPTQEEKELFIALLSNVLFEGFVEENKTLLAYIKKDDEQHHQEEINTLLKNKTFTKREIENKNWNEEWENSIDPIFFEDFLYIKADFHNIKHPCKYEITITPKMSFGTGHHATTSTIIEIMKTLDFKNKSILDYGAGTGILAILAELLGAKEIVAIDNDENCIQSIQENTTKNKNKYITYYQSNTLPEKKFDIILCNINLNFILENIETLIHLLFHKGILILSGFYTADTKQILHKIIPFINSEKIHIQTQKGKNNWTTITLLKK